jgi:hypothetical protein
VRKKIENGHCAAFAKTVHYKEPRVDEEHNFYFITFYFYGPLGGTAALSVFFHINPHVGVALHGGNRAALLTTIAAAKPSEEHMKNSATYSLKDVTLLLQKRAHVIEYALANGLVPEPQLRLGGRRIFTPADVQRLAKHFGVTLTTLEPAAELAGV